MKKKLSFLLVAFMAIATFAWADDLNESSGNQGSSSTAIAGTSYTLDGKFVAGQGSVQQGNMPDKGVKLRSNQGNLVFEVNAGYKITKFEFWGCGNTTTTVDIVSATVDDGTTNLLSGTVTLPAKGDNTSGDIVLSDIAAEKNITLTFAQGSTAQIVGTWKVTYEQTAVIQKEITGVTLNGTPISENDLAQLKANKTVTIDGSSLNGAGAVVVTLSSGATTVAKTFENSTAVYTFKVDNDEYKIYVRGVAKTYTEEGTVVAFSANGTNATGANTKTITMNGISFSMVADKTFQYGSGNVTLGENVYVPLKLSTGSAVNVTFPEGKKATKVKIYGWSANGDGKLYAMKESADGEKSVDVSNDVYYATNTGADIYPSVYEYNLDNWESLWFNAGGSPSQPFVVMEFTFAEEQPEARTYAIVGDFTGGWPAEIDDDGSKDVEMTADPTAEGIYTLTIKDFDAEAKKYEYKLRANKSWNVYNLPADGNQDFVFGTNDYPAGKYDLTFTADVNKHVLTLDVVKAEESVEETEYTVQFVNGADWKQVYAYTWTGDGVSSEKVEQLGVWAGTEMGLIDTEAEIDGKKYPVYELKFKAAVEPANIIFSDGTGGEAGKTQTADQEFVDGYRYALVIDDEPVNPDQQEEEIEFTAAGTGTNPMVYTKDHFTYTFDKGSGSTNPAYVTSAEETRLYAKGTLTIKAKASEKIIAISYDATLNANKNGVTPTIDGVAGKTNAGTWDAENWSWTGEDTEVTMTTSGTAGNVGFKGITVTYTDEGGGGDQPVEIKTLAINGEFPGMSWNPEEGIAMQPEATAAGLWTLELKNVTVEGKQYDYKAFADGKTDGYQLPAQGNNNWVFGTDEYPAGTYDLLFTANTSTNELTLAPTYVGPNTIAQLNALANKKEFTFTGNAIVVAKMEGESSQTIDNYIYIKDETGSSLIYDKGGAHSNESDKTKGLLVGDVITAPWNGTVSIYKNLFEVRPAGDEQLTASENVGEVTYPEATADDVKAENVNQVVEIKGLTIDNVDGKNIKFTIGDDLVNGWNQFGIELPEVTEGKTFDVVGAISIYGENVQFQPFTITEVEPQLNPYTATFTTNLGWKPVYAYAYNYTPADEAEGVQEHIYVPVEWPGTPMTLNAETGVYEVAIESAEEPNLIIFNDGTKEGSQVGINQTPNWEFENGKAYDYSTQPFKVTFNTDKWENVWAYTWTGETPTVEWPGVAMKGDKGVYTYEFEAIEAPEMIIFNNGTEAEVKEQTGDLPFVNGTTYTFSEEKATAWAGDPDVAIEETGIIIPAETLVKADVQAEKIIRIVAKEIAVAAPARGLDNTVTEGETIPFTVTKKDGTLLVEDKDITVTDDPGSGGKAYEFTVSPDASTEVTTNGFIIKPKDEKNIAVTAIEVEKAKAPAAEDINITPEAGADIAEALATAKAAVAKVGNITINLTADANYTVSAPIEVPAALTINGNGATIDASGQTGNFIEMAVVENPTEWTEANVTVKELTVKGLKKALFYSACKNYFGDVTVDKCVVEQAADATTFDYTKGSTAVNFTVTNSTFYAPTATTKSFYSSQGGQKTTEYNGEAVQTFTFTNNTMYNLASGKNFFTHRQNNQKWLKFVAKNNIFVNCGKSGQTIKGMNGGGVSANPQFDIDGNVFNYGGADTGAAEETGDADEPVQNTIAGVVTFTDATAGNFNGVITVENVVATVPGDPRWTITAVKQLYIIGGPKEWKLDDMTEMTFNAETQAFEFEYAPTATAYFAFADKQFTAEEAAADGAWDVFNANNRYALDEGDKDATLNEAVALQKVNGTIVLNPGTYKISVAKDFSTVTITGEAAAKYYLVGSMTDWEIDANYELTPDNENAGQYKITVDLAADAQFKIVNSDKTVWYPDGMGNNYGENGELQGAGKYTVYFRPNADGGDDWFYHVIFAQKFYNITVVNCDGMTITPEVTEATAGTKVWAAVAMTDGYEPEFPGFTNTDTGDVIEMTEGTDVGMDEETGKVWIIMPAQNLTITAKAAKVSLITLDLSQENGSATCISVNKEDPASFYKKEGKEIYLNVTPDAGYTADITVTAGEDPVEVIAEAGTYHEQAYTHKFIMPAKAVTVKVVFTKADAINGIDAEDADDNTPIYNLSGQKVTKSYKGVVIKNGKKYMQK